MAFTAPTSDLDATGFTAPSADLIPDTKQESVGFIAPSSDISDDPTLGEVGSGLVADIALAEGLKYAGAAGGTALGPAGTVVGYIGGATIGGVAGSIAAQKIEGRDDISWGRVVGDTLLNFIPGSKLAKGGSFAARAGKAALKQGAIGAAIAPAAQVVEGIVDEGKIPTMEELGGTAVRGSLLGAGLGGASVGLERLLGKVGGKTIDEVDEMVATGDLTFKDFKLIGPTTPDADSLMRRELEQTAQRKAAEIAARELVKSQDIASKQKGVAGKIFASIAPSKVVGRKSQQAAIDFGRNVKTAEELGSKIAKNLEKKIGSDEATNTLVNRMLDGDNVILTKEQSKKLGSSLQDIYKYQELKLERQKDLLSLLDEGAYARLDDNARQALQEAVKESIGKKAYNRREYKLFLDPKYVEDPKLEAAAFNELATKMGPAKAKAHMDKLRNASAATREMDPRTFLGAPVDSVLRKRHNPGAAERKWLGEVTEAPERIRGTLSGLGKSVARAEADLRITKSLLEDGIASTQKSEGMVELVLRGTGKEGTGVYVNPEVQIALNNIYLPSSDRGTENIVINALQDLYRASVAGSKASKVLLNTVAYPVQLYGNTATLMGMGINPFSKSAIRGARVAAGDVPVLNNILDNFGGNTPQGRKAMLDDIEEMSKYGIKNANILDSDLRDTLDNGIFSRVLNKVTDPVGKLYSVPDTMGRYVGWKANQNTLRKMFPEASDDLIKREAAHLINDTYQNYDKLSNVVRTLSRWGVMPQFASFTAEFARNQYNQGKYIAQMLSGKYKGISDMGKANVGAMRREGAKRAAALAAVYGGTYGAIEGVKAASGLEQEDQDALRDLAYAPWDKNREQMVKYDKKTRKGWTANPSYIVPHAIGLSALKAGMRGDDEAAVVNMLFEEMVGEGSFIMQEAFRALENRDQYGKDISNEMNDLRNAADRIKYFIAESFRPGVARELKKFAQAKRGAGDLTLADVGQRQLGLRSNPFDVNEAAKFSVRGNYEPAKQEASQYYSTLKYQEPTPEESQAAYMRAERINRESFDAMMRNKQSMTQLNFTEDEIIKTFKDAGVPSKQILNILNGTYTPLPRVKLPSASETYDELQGSREAKLGQIRQLMKTDKAMAQQLLKRWKQEAKATNLSPRDQLLRNLDIAERVSYLRANPSKLRELRSKGIATDAVIRAYNLSK